ncbi:MAG: hypothetical protein M3Z14_08385 [Candidatus Eremiobacteraeota bacterium]|nr:hypothetical protein [Candidatus Eremiobacteraeota bacterium]
MKLYAFSVFFAVVLATQAQARGFQTVHHPVSTKSVAAQDAFDQGLTLLYGYNRTDARKHFAEAARLDPHLAIAYWGLAAAYGPNINVPMFPGFYRRAQIALREAERLTRYASPAERLYIRALSVRYPTGKSDSRDPAYAAAMHKVAALLVADSDAQTLYAESIMNYARLYDRTKKVLTPEGEAADRVLRGVLSKHPHHIGANHLLIHADEIMRHPADAASAARYLSTIHLDAGESHLVHMGGHVFAQIGDWPAMLAGSKIATDDDLIEERRVPNDPEITTYHRHNTDFLTGAALMMGDDQAMHSAARELARINAPALALYYLRVGNWKGVLNLKRPAGPDGRGLWLFARAIAAAQTDDNASSQAAVRELDRERRASPQNDDLQMFSNLASARIHACSSSSEALFKSALKLQRSRFFEDYFIWYFPVAQWYGESLMARGDLSKARSVLQSALASEVANPYITEDLARADDRLGLKASAASRRAAYVATWKAARSPGLEITCRRL